MKTLQRIALVFDGNAIQPRCVVPLPAGTTILDLVTTSSGLEVWCAVDTEWDGLASEQQDIAHHIFRFVRAGEDVRPDEEFVGVGWPGSRACGVVFVSREVTR